MVQPPVYTPPTQGNYYAAPPPAYAPPTGQTYAFIPYQTFPTQPPGKFRIDLIQLLTLVIKNTSYHVS